VNGANCSVQLHARNMGYRTTQALAAANIDKNATSLKLVFPATHTLFSPMLLQ
jgi:hypothetical protein